MSKAIFCVVLALALMSCGRRAPAPQIVDQPVVAGLSGPSVLYPAFADADPHDWERRRPEHYPVHGLDVSRWQGPIDWRQAKASGVSFVFIKATEGGDVADPMFQDLENFDFTLKPDSPALQRGFEPIPFEAIGLVEKPAVVRFREAGLTVFDIMSGVR